MKNIKRLISSLLVVIMLVSMMTTVIPASVFAADASHLVDAATAASRTNTLVNKLNGKFFTTNQVGCSSNACNYCKNTNVIATTWFKNTMNGFVPDSANIMPKHYYSSTQYISPTAWTCAGFAAYAMWYIYAKNTTDNVIGINIYTGNFTKSDMDRSGVRTGDIIRVTYDTGKGHSFIYISHDSTGVLVLDSNWDQSNGKNLVGKHYIKWSWKSGSQMAITRGKNWTGTHTHSYVKGYETAHPHKIYMKCSCGDEYYIDERYSATCALCNLPSKPTLTAYPGTNYGNTILISSVSEHATSYDFRVFNAVTDEQIKMNYFHNRIIEYSLPAGEYYATVAAVNESFIGTGDPYYMCSDPVYFTVTEGYLVPVKTVEYNGNRYELYLNRYNWGDAKYICESKGGHLATITSAEEQAVVEKLAAAKSVFLGASDVDGVWKWVTGEEFSYSNWGANEPNNKGYISEDFLGMYGNGKWNDYDYVNEAVNGFICEFEHTHSYTSKQTQAPTCTVTGVMTYSCSCGNSYTESIPIIDHTPGTWTKTREPSYIQKGVEEQYCTGCGVQLDKRSIPMLTYVNKFTDVKDNAWYADEVAYVVKHGYMNGMSETKFSPNSNITREQFVMILANYSKANLPNYVGKTGFSDVPEGKWYSNAVQWARKKGYTDGVGNGKFGLGQEVTREQIAKFLYNYAEVKGRDVTGRADITEYTDDTKVSSWALEAVKWAVHKGIITSTRNDSLVISPRSTTTRAQAARMFMIFNETK